jgi:hypothetical protein
MQKAVGRGRKEKKDSEVGEKSLSGSGSLASIRRPEKPAPILCPLNSGTTPGKAFRIRSVRNSIIAFPMNRELEPNYPPYLCINVAVPEAS